MDVVTLVNMALDEIRARASVTSINPSDGSKAGDVASRHYQPRMDALARAVHWNCLRYQASLSLISAAGGTPENPNSTPPFPPQPWLYEYAWPSSPACLKARFILPPINTAVGGIPFMTNLGISQPAFTLKGAVPFVVSTDLDQNGNQIRVILTNTSQSQLIYTSRVLDPTLWDSNLIDAAVMYLAAWICEPITGSDKLTSEKVQLASALIQAARISDGNEGPQSVDNTPDFIRVRAGQPPWAPIYFVGWDQVSFPGGIAI